MFAKINATKVITRRQICALSQKYRLIVSNRVKKTVALNYKRVNTCKIFKTNYIVQHKSTIAFSFTCL